MTPEEAIEIIHEKHIDMEFYFAEHDRYPKYYDFDFDQAALIAAQALKEIQQYREIGTVKECRKAVEKQISKKIQYESDYRGCNGFTRYQMGKCPICDEWYNDIDRDKYNYCHKCGNKLNWSNENESNE